MYKAVSECCFNADWTLAQKFAYAKKVGFDAMEPDFGQTGPLSMTSTDAQVLEIGRMASDAGVRLTSVTCSYWGTPFTSDEASVREQGKTILRRHMEVSKLLGAPVVLVVPGTVGSGFWGTGGVGYDVAYVRAGEAFDEMKAYARQLDIIIGIENVWNQFLLSPLEMARFIDERNSPHVQGYFDVGNVLVHGNPVDWIRILGKRIARVHVKDFKKSVGNINGFCELLTGDVDFPAVVAALRQVGYAGPLTVELGADTKYPGATVARAAAAMDLILA